MSSRQSRRRKGNTRRSRRTQPSKQTSSPDSVSELKSAKDSLLRAGEKRSSRRTNLPAGAAIHDDNREVMVPGMTLGNLAYVRKDLLRIMLLAAITLVILIGAALFLR